MTTKPLMDMLVDSLVIAGIALFSISGELSDASFWTVGLKAFALAFVVQMAIERGLKTVVNNGNKKISP